MTIKGDNEIAAVLSGAAAQLRSVEAALHGLDGLSVDDLSSFPDLPDKIFTEERNYLLDLADLLDGACQRRR